MLITREYFTPTKTIYVVFITLVLVCDFQSLNHFLKKKCDREIHHTYAFFCPWYFVLAYVNDDINVVKYLYNKTK